MWMLALFGGCDVLHQLLVERSVVHRQIITDRTFRDNDPRKSEVRITGLDSAGCDRSFAFYGQAPGPSPMHTVACSDLRYVDEVCTFYCEITGPL